MTCIVQPTYLVFHAKTLESAATSGSLHAASVSSLSTAAPTGLAPAQIRTAYGINLITSGGIQGNGSGQTIAIVNAYDAPNLLDSTDPGFDTSDLHQFDAQFGLPDPPSFRKVGQDGSANLAPASGSSGWSVESSLDVEWAHAVAPGANIVLVEANDASLTSIMAAIDTARNLPGVSVVSMSFGTSEYAGETASDSTFTTPAGHTGVTFVASTGDGGRPVSIRRTHPMCWRSVGRRSTSPPTAAMEGKRDGAVAAAARVRRKANPPTKARCSILAGARSPTCPSTPIRRRA